MGEFIGLADNEGIKREARIKRRGPIPARVSHARRRWCQAFRQGLRAIFGWLTGRCAPIGGNAQINPTNGGIFLLP